MVLKPMLDSPDTFVVYDDEGRLIGRVPFTLLPLDREPPRDTVFLEAGQTRIDDGRLTMGD